MSILSNIVNTIRTAVYGKDMREAIARGFENIDEQMSGGFGGGFVLMEEDVPIGDRKDNVLYGKIKGSIGDETAGG